MAAISGNFGFTIGKKENLGSVNMHTVTVTNNHAATAQNIATAAGVEATASQLGMNKLIFVQPQYTTTDLNVETSYVNDGSQVSFKSSGNVAIAAAQTVTLLVIGK